jgi:hypothetical protein
MKRVPSNSDFPAAWTDPAGVDHAAQVHHLVCRDLGAADGEDLLQARLTRGASSSLLAILQMRPTVKLAPPGAVS